MSSEEFRSLSDSACVLKEEVTFGDWQIQLKLACEADRLEDVAAIASLHIPQMIVLRYSTTVSERPSVAVTENTMLFSTGAKRTTHRDVLIPFATMRTQDECPLLPDFPERGSSEGRKLQNALLRKPHKFSGTCLFWVKSLAALRLLEEIGADTQDLGWMGNPLVVFMAKQGQANIVRFLVDERGHSPNAARADGLYSALHWAKGLDVVQYLIERGGDANALTSSGDSVLAQQLRYEQTDTVDYLLSLSEKRASRANLFHWLDAKPAVLRVLCRHDLNLDQSIEAVFGESYAPLVMHRILSNGIASWKREKDRDGKTDRADAVTECLDILLTHGCNPLLRDGSNRLAYHVVQDLLPDTEEPLRQALDERLAKYDGPRSQGPQPEGCTCGSNL